MKKILLFLILNSYISANLYNNESPSDQFINRWQFTKIANFIYDPSTKIRQVPTNVNGVTFDPKLVKHGDIILVRHVDRFFKIMHPQISNPYIIITHGNYLDTFHPKYLKYLNESNVLAWFGIHASTVNHAKFHHIPIGIWQNRDLNNNNSEVNNLFKKLRKDPKSKLLYCNFTLGMHKDRPIVKKILTNKNLYEEITPKDFHDYAAEMSEYKFTVSPRGMGIDCYRTWEALLVGSIPIVKSSQLDALYKDLPVLIIKSWDQLSEEFLIKKYKKITQKKYSLEKLYINYWEFKIKSIQINI